MYQSCVQPMQPLNVVEMLGNPKYTHPLPEITVGTALRAAKRAAGLIVYSIWAASSSSYRDDGVCPRCWGVKSFRQEAEPGASPAGFTQATAPGDERIRRERPGFARSFILCARFFPGPPSRRATKH